MGQSIQLIRAVIFLIILISQQNPVSAKSIGLYIVLTLIGCVKGIHREHYDYCIIFIIYYILGLIFLNFTQYAYDAIDTIIMILLQMIVVVLCISYTELIRKRQINN